jgi:hypothetical protein
MSEALAIALGCTCTLYVAQPLCTVMIGIQSRCLQDSVHVQAAQHRAAQQEEDSRYAN